jgi:hypothetical protein
MRYLIILLFSFYSFSQSASDPRLRVSVAPNLVLSTTFQTINLTVLNH